MPTLEGRLKALQRMPKLPRILRPGVKSPSAVALRRGVVTLGGRLKSLEKVAHIQVGLTDGGGKRRELNLLVTPEGPRFLARPTSRPSVAFVMSQADWVDIASGRTPPAVKYLTGRVRVIGDCRLARQIYLTLTKDSSGRIA